MRVSVKPAVFVLALITMTASACSSASKGAAGAGANGTASAGAAAQGGSAATSAPAAAAAGADIDACKLLSLSQAQSLDGRSYSGTQSQTIAPGQDQCTYSSSDDGSDLVIIIYQPNSGVTWDMMTTVLSSVGTTNSVSGVGDKAEIGAIEIDAQAGSRLVSVEGAGGTVSGTPDKAEAVAKAVIAALG
jgi:hypothetical protein